MEKVRQVQGVKGVKGSEGEKEEFVVDAELDREPVEADKGGGDVLPGPGVCEEFCTYLSLSRALLGTPNRTLLQ